MVSRLEMARAISTPLLIPVKIGLTLASVLRRLDPATVPPDLCAPLEMPILDADRGVEELITIYETIPTPRRKRFLSIATAAGDDLRGRRAAAPRSARRAR